MSGSIASRSPLSTSFRYVRFGIGVADDRLAVDLLAGFQRDADGLAVLDDDLLDLGIDADLDAGLFGRGRDRLADRAHAAAREAPGADLPVDLAHVVVQQHVGRARRIGPERGADDGGCGGEALPARRLEILVEEIGDRHRPEADHVVHVPLAQPPELAADLQQALEVLAMAPGIDAVLHERIDLRRIRRRHQQRALDEAAIAADLHRVFVVRLGVADRMAAQRFARAVVVAVIDDPLALRIGRGVDVVRDDLQPVARQVEEAENLRPQQRADVGAGRIGEAGILLFRHGGAADLLAPLQHQHLQLVLAVLLAALGEIGRAGQAVVAAADDDRVIGLLHRPARAQEKVKRIAAAASPAEAGASCPRAQARVNK